MRGAQAHGRKTQDEMEKKTSSTVTTAVVAFVAAAATAVLLLLPLPAAAKRGEFLCAVENRMREEMHFLCDDEWLYPVIGDSGHTVKPGETWEVYYHNKTEGEEGRRVTCTWSCAGNTMNGVVKWDQEWPEAPSCVKYRRPDAPGCRLVFENGTVTLVSGAGGRRVLGDLAVKECSKNYGGWGGWVPFGLACTYPKHDHPYVGTIG